MGMRQSWIQTTFVAFLAMLVSNCGSDTGTSGKRGPLTNIAIPVPTFSATLEGTNITLTWSVDDPTNVSHFEIEKKVGDSFELLEQTELLTMSIAIEFPDFYTYRMRTIFESHQGTLYSEYSEEQTVALLTTVFIEGDGSYLIGPDNGYELVPDSQGILTVGISIASSQDIICTLFRSGGAVLGVRYNLFIPGVGNLVGNNNPFTITIPAGQTQVDLAVNYIQPQQPIGQSVVAQLELQSCTGATEIDEGNQTAFIAMLN